MNTVYEKAKAIVDSVPIEDREYIDEWFEHEGIDVNVCGSYLDERAPVNGVVVDVYPCKMPPEYGQWPEPTNMFTVGEQTNE